MAVFSQFWFSLLGNHGHFGRHLDGEQRIFS